MMTINQEKKVFDYQCTDMGFGRTSVTVAVLNKTSFLLPVTDGAPQIPSVSC